MMPTRHAQPGLVLALALLLSAAPAGGRAWAEPEQATDLARCTGDSPAVATTAGMLACAGAVRDAAEARIARLLGEAAAPAGPLDPARLRQAQAAWQQARDSHCALFDPGAAQGGSLTRVEIAFCAARAALHREAELGLLLEARRPR